MNRHTTILELPQFQVARFGHLQGGNGSTEPHHDPREEFAEEYSINYVEYGSFEIKIGRRWQTLTPGDLFLTYPGLSYRCRHQEEFPTDSCLSVQYVDDEPVQPLIRFARKAVVLPATNRVAYLLRGLGSSGSAKSSLAAEHLAAELVPAVCTSDSRQLRRHHQFAWYAERVDAARQRLETKYAYEHSLAELARSVGMSTFHFARVFAELAGAPPHRYLLRVRLAEAARRLRAGAGVTDACFNSGFTNLSHFVRMFRRHFGIPPSQYARQHLA